MAEVVNIDVNNVSSIPVSSFLGTFVLLNQKTLRDGAGNPRAIYDISSKDKKQKQLFADVHRIKCS